MYKKLRRRKLTDDELRYIQVLTREVKPRTKKEREQAKTLQEVLQIA